VIDAVDGVMTRGAAAQRFGVAASSAIKWVRQWRQKGSVQARPRGGDRRSHQIEAHSDEILRREEEIPDIALAEIATHMEDRHGLRVAQSMIWRLLDRHGLTFKKNGIRH